MRSTNSKLIVCAYSTKPKSYWWGTQWGNTTVCRYARSGKNCSWLNCWSVLLGSWELCWGRTALSSEGLEECHRLTVIFNLKQNYPSWPNLRNQDKTKPCTLHIHRAIKICRIYIGQKIRLLDWLLVLCGETRLLFLSGSTCASEIPIRHKQKTL